MHEDNIVTVEGGIRHKVKESALSSQVYCFTIAVANPMLHKKWYVRLLCSICV